MIVVVCVCIDWAWRMCVGVGACVRVWVSEGGWQEGYVFCSDNLYYGFLFVLFCLVFVHYVYYHQSKCFSRFSAVPFCSLFLN